MNRIMALVAVLGLLGSVAATAQDEGAGQLFGRRQMALCMNKQMAASRTLSYNEAARLCKERAKDQQIAAASAAPASPGTKPGS